MKPSVAVAYGQLDLPKASPPSVVAAALGPRMLRVAGELTDSTVTAWTGAKVIEQHIIPHIAAAAPAADRPAPQVIVGLPVSVTRVLIDDEFATAEKRGLMESNPS
jgi:alkanesulfonate monooxygenase SsuD/methylene tetrahydromethanopterin reductase-like flavin-dependent oxidoreductase (luciferase family)